MAAVIIILGYLSHANSILSGCVEAMRLLPFYPAQPATITFTSEVQPSA
jgi:hypothetical protein